MYINTLFPNDTLAAASSGTALARPGRSNGRGARGIMPDVTLHYFPQSIKRTRMTQGGAQDSLSIIQISEDDGSTIPLEPDHVEVPVPPSPSSDFNPSPPPRRSPPPRSPFAPGWQNEGVKSDRQHFFLSLIITIGLDYHLDSSEGQGQCFLAPFQTNLLECRGAVPIFLF